VATEYISKVRLEPKPFPSRHDHIALVMLRSGTIEARSTVIARIRRGDSYYTAASPPASVYVHPCPHCKAHDYITTHRDSTPTNNLLNLPKF
jgi:hypothetical protein